MENITRISDLPDQNNSVQNSISEQSTQPQTNYTPINIHPNPYGISGQNPIITNQENQMINTSQKEIQQNINYSEEQLQRMQNQRLPSRDIPQNTLNIIQDEQIRANYIPKVKFEEDYVKKYEDMTEKNLHEYEEKTKKEKKMDIIFNELQTPIFVAILFFFFQLPFVNQFLKRFSFLSIYNSDGNFNFKGLILKSIIFGSLYYTITKGVNIINEF
jgi:nitrogen fixation/metabolism regulation signal transduction histidine kinase